MRKHILGTIGTVLSSVLLVNCYMPIAYASTYRDVVDTDWHADAIEYVTELGLMEGVGNDSFQPNQVLTRAQVVTLLYRLAGSPETGYVKQFEDVPKNGTQILFRGPISKILCMERLRPRFHLRPTSPESSLRSSYSITQSQLELS